MSSLSASVIIVLLSIYHCTTRPCAVQAFTNTYTVPKSLRVAHDPSITAAFRPLATLPITHAHAKAEAEANHRRSSLISRKASVVGSSDLHWDAESTASEQNQQSRNDNADAAPQKLSAAAADRTQVDSTSSASTTQTKPKSIIPISIFNLIKAVIGCGLLVLPSGLAAVSNSPKAVIPAAALVSTLGAFSAYTFGLYGRLVHQTQARSLGELWERQKSKSSSWMISAATMAFCFGGALSYVIMLGDVTESFAHAAGWTSGILSSRALWVSLLAGTTLLPLCNLQSLAALAPMSLVGVFAILFTTAFVAFRCPAINPASPYSILAGTGSLLSTLTSSQLPTFNTFNKGIGHPSSLLLVGMAATAFLGHFSAPDFYHGLREHHKNQLSPADDATSSSNAIRDFLKVTTRGFSGIIGINALLLVAGFLTFGGNSQGIILNNYSALDPFAAFCRILMAINVIGSFPFIFRGCRTEVLSLMKKNDLKTERKVTKIMISMLVGCSLVLRNAGMVIGFNGAVMGSALVYIFPSLLFLNYTGGLGQLTRSQKLERWFCRFLVGFGGLAAVVGGTVSIVNAFFPHLLM